LIITFSFPFDSSSQETYTQHGIIYYAEEADFFGQQKFWEQEFPDEGVSTRFTAFSCSFGRLWLLEIAIIWEHKIEDL
jgi:hypothetical protein